MNSSTVEPIAIIGIGCRFPGDASSPQKFWELLCQGKNAISEVSEERWDTRRFYHPDHQAPGKMYVNKGGFLKEKWEEFDAEFFHISPREAPFLDPQQRLLLELAWESMEDAGIIPEKVRQSDAGVFIGAFTTDWQSLHSHPSNMTHCSGYTGINASMTILSARLSYFFDLKGPCLTIDTACSSSLVAVHLACQNLRENSCSMAFAGGVNAMIIPQTTITMSKGRFLNPDGHCCAFAENAKGYIRGEGGGIVLLKRLSDALRDGDSIYALIRGTGINHDGATQGIAQPNPEAQKTLIQHVLGKSQVKPEEILYVEAHGTGTPIGDPLEAKALNDVLNVPGRSQPCFLGAVKTNLGHLEAAAGVAGLIKTALCLKQSKIPPNLHFKEANPHIPFEKYCLKIPTQMEDFPPSDFPPFACVNAFGYGGTNAHAVLQRHEEVSQKPYPYQIFEQPILIPFTAVTANALKDATKNHEHFLQEHPNLNLIDIAHTLIKKRSLFDHRLAISARSTLELKNKLRQFNSNENSEGCANAKILESHPQLAFVYTGMGPQWWGMGRQLIQNSPLFLKTMELCDHYLSTLMGWSLLEELSKEETQSRIAEPDVAQLANYAIQISLTEVLKSWGIVPQGIVGHSIGEVAAAQAAGALTLEEGLLVAYHRSRIQKTKKHLGGMLAAGLELEQAKQIVEKYQHVSIAAINSPQSVTLAGNSDELQKISDILEKKNIFNRFLKVNIAYHSHQMDGLEQEVLASLSFLKPTNPVVPLYSTVDGLLNTAPLDAHYWWQNIRQPVLFSQSLQTMIQQGFHLFVEIGPHPVLASFIKENLNHCQVKGETLHTLNRKKADLDSLMECVGGLFVNGYSIHWDKLQPAKGEFIPLPTYPWQKKRHWIESEESLHYRLSAKQHVMLSRKIKCPEPVWQVEINNQYFPWLEDHKIAGTILFPAAGYVEAGLALHGTIPCTLEQIHFENMLTINPETEKVLQISLRDGNKFLIHSLSEADNWECHAHGLCSGYVNQNLPEKMDLQEWVGSRFLSEDAIYEQFTQKGLEYGASFRGIKKLWKRKGEGLAEIQITGSANNDYLFPPLLDAAFQTLIGAIDTESFDGLILPFRIDQAIVYRKPGNHLFCHALCTHVAKEKIVGDLILFDETGEVCVQIKGLQCRLFANSSKQQSDHLLYHLDWEEKPLAEQPVMNEKYTWLIPEYLPFSLADSRIYSLHQLESLEESEQLLAHVQSAEHLHVVFGCSHSGDVSGEEEIQLVNRCLNLVKAIDQKRNSTYTTLWIVTHGTQYVNHSTTVHMQGASLWGLARVIRQEYPRLLVRILDLDPGLPFEGSPIVQEAVHQAPEEEIEIAWRQGTRFAHHLYRKENHSYSEKLVELSSPHDAFSLDLKKAGSIENLYYKQIPKKSPGIGEVAVQVHSASLNFKDLMKVLGMLDQNVLEKTYFGTSFGMECSGTIVAVGPKVKYHQIGDKVCAFVPNTFQSYIHLPVEFIYPTPPQATLEVAPVYIPFVTALRALKDIAKLKKGETILIHSAAGAVGLAAIQYAQYVGARIIATAGSEDKRVYLRQLGVLACADSRSLSFVDDVLKWTGKGVDVVLNSLGGEALIKSWGLLAPYGRFVEIGKRDISTNRSLPMQPFNNNTSFTAVDLDRTFIDQPKLIKKLLNEAFALFSKNIFKPLPCKQFPANQSVEAFQFMARSKHIGKIMLQFDKQTVEGISLDAQQPLIKSRSSYLITGGFSGFGLQIAQWLVSKGAKQLILVGRSGASSAEALHMLKQFKKLGVKVKEAAVDITNLDRMKRLLEECKKDMHPIKGIIHSAMVLDDKFIFQMTQDSVQKVLSPKITGCLHLHQLTHSLPLDFFVLFSSISSVIGNPGQANYAAANAFLDSFCSYRHCLGLPALTINWGALDSGVLSRNVTVAKQLESHGIRALPIKMAFHVLEKALIEKKRQLCAFDLDWEKVLERMPALKNSTMFSLFSHGKSYAFDHSFREQLHSLDENKRLDFILDVIKDTIAKTLKMDAAKMDIHSRLNTFGIDSLMAMELQTAMEIKMNVKIPTMELMKGPTIKQLAQVSLELIESK